MVLGHVILCVSSGVAVSLYSSPALTWQFGTFAILLGHGIIGIIDCISETSEQSGRLFKITLSIVDVVPLPFINTELYMASSMGTEIAQLHAISGIAPLAAGLFFDEGSVENLKDIVIIGNVISLVYLAITQDKPIYGALAAIGAINRFVIGKTGQTAQGLSIGLSVFALCAAHILKNSELSKLTNL